MCFAEVFPGNVKCLLFCLKPSKYLFDIMVVVGKLFKTSSKTSLLTTTKTSTEVLRRSPQWALNTHTHTNTHTEREKEREKLTSRA